ncbi:AMP-binding protein [Nocardioides endophyticus]|uniref:AMP-binding protein n=1 Tax=Nocardioides endophyticus TaxID=1353775 RepID=UPI0031E99645
MTHAAQAQPDAIAVVGLRSDGSSPIQLTYAELDDLASRFAVGLERQGVGPGDVVAVMLPNRPEFTALAFAINQVGATYTGIPVAYGPGEVEAILRISRARAVVAVDRFRGSSPASIVRELRSQLPDLQSVVVAEPDAALAGTDVTLEELSRSAGSVVGNPPAFDEVCHLGFTSGTTGPPKGVMNSCRSLLSVMSGLTVHLGRPTFGEPMVNLVGSPMGHHTGYLWGILLSTWHGATAVLLDQWQPARAAGVIEEYGVTVMFGAPTFLQDLMALPSAAGPTRFVMAGAPVPRHLPGQAATQLGTQVLPAWGMTEYGIGIACPPWADPYVYTTDGLPVPGCEVRVVGDDDEVLPVGRTGELQIRGTGLFHGYLDRPDANEESFVDGWFRTGDTASIDGIGCVSLQGRIKDIIIRGGENIPVSVVEDALALHPLLDAATVVATPDERLGERACAVIVPLTSVIPSFEELSEFLLAKGVSKHFLPERLVVMDALPMTPSGKIKKAELRSLVPTYLGDSRVADARH